MKISRRVETFNDRYPLVGPAFWIISVQYFLIQLIVALDWARPYSITRNSISDLGNTVCGLYRGSYICSPLHIFMNASFIILGLTMVVGSSLIYHEFKEGRPAVIGFTFMALAGLGTTLVGIFPENTIGILHEAGAGLPFFVGNLGIIILGASLEIPLALRLYTMASGLISIFALTLLLAKVDLGLGPGGMERVTAYPQTIWIIVFGLYMSRRHYAKARSKERN